MVTASVNPKDRLSVDLNLFHFHPIQPRIASDFRLFRHCAERKYALLAVGVPSSLLQGTKLFDTSVGCQAFW